MIVLGISCHFHDASATLIKDGRIIAAAEEERFTRLKHDNSFPVNAIKFCLEKANIDISDVNSVGFYEKPLLKFERAMHQHFEMFPFSLKLFLKSIPSWFSEKLRIKKKLKKLGYKGDVIYIPHHLSHAASAFLPSSFDKAAIVTVDGVGEWATTTIGVGESNNIEIIKELRFPNSIGLLYSTITAYLGMSVNNSEYKVMALAAYGNNNRETNKYYSNLNSIIKSDYDGFFELDMSYFKFHYTDRMPSQKLCDLLGGPISEKDTEMTQRHKDIAAALQMVTEDAMISILKYAHFLVNNHSETKCENVVLAGGVALNSVFNGKILNETPFKKVWIQPNASDGGGSMGVALFISNCINSEVRIPLHNAYLGPAFSNETIETFLLDKEIVFSSFENWNELVDKTAKLIFENNVVGWFQGEMEWGPRALGSRSILSNPCNKDMQEILNEKVKHRECFRPFAPVVCAEDAHNYFVFDEALTSLAKFMLMVCPVKEEFRDKLPAITHVDGSARVQVLTEDQNSLFYHLIKRFGELSGIPVLINTSFNIRGEPIVCTPYDAFRCMMGTQIDYLIMGDFLIARKDNLKFAWDGERVAKD